MTERKEGGHHVFDPKKWKKLESPERREKMNPEKLAEAMNLKGDEVVLDIGCGTGFFAEPVAKRCGKLIGLDISEDMLAMFRGRDGFENLGDVELKQGDANDIPLENGSCDVAFHVCFLHEVRDVEKFHAEIRRVLKPGGRYLLADWHAWETGWGPPVDHRVSRESAMEWMKRDGFTDVKELDIYEDQYVLEGWV